jgi:hypothetical protein
LHVKLADEPLCGLLQQNQVQSTPDSILPREKHFAAEKITDQPSAYPRAAERDIHVGKLLGTRCDRAKSGAKML